jgi:hypothetical protein
VEGITSGAQEDGTDSLPHLTNAKPDPDGPAPKSAAGEGLSQTGAHSCLRVLTCAEQPAVASCQQIGLI